jgi:septal ring factor EnvC (AmiA/AmiB activator)
MSDVQRLKFKTATCEERIARLEADIARLIGDLNAATARNVELVDQIAERDTTIKELRGKSAERMRRHRANKLNKE